MEETPLQTVQNKDSIQQAEAEYPQKIAELEARLQTIPPDDTETRQPILDQIEMLHKSHLDILDSEKPSEDKPSEDKPSEDTTKDDRAIQLAYLEDLIKLTNDAYIRSNVSEDAGSLDWLRDMEGFYNAILELHQRELNRIAHIPGTEERRNKIREEMEKVLAEQQDFKEKAATLAPPQQSASPEFRTGGLHSDSSSDDDDDKKVPMPPEIHMTPELQAQIQQVEQQTPPPDDSMTPREAAYLRGEVPTARTPGLSLYQKAPPPRKRGPQPESEAPPLHPPAPYPAPQYYQRPPPPPQHPQAPYPAPQYYRPPPPVPPPPPQVPAYMQQPLPRNYQPPPPPPQPQPQGAFGMTRNGNIPGVQQPHPVWPPPPSQSGSRWGKSGDWNHRSWVDRDGKPPPS